MATDGLRCFKACHSSYHFLDARQAASNQQTNVKLPNYQCASFDFGGSR